MLLRYHVIHVYWHQLSPQLKCFTTALYRLFRVVCRRVLIRELAVARGIQVDYSLNGDAPIIALMMTAVSRLKLLA